MIAQTSADVPKLVAEVERQAEEAREIFSQCSAEALLWRPSEQKWSVAEHLEHLSILNGPYVTSMQACLVKARAKGQRSDGPYRHPWFGRWFAGLMEPPVKRRMGTAKAMIPASVVDGATVLQRFLRVQGELAETIQDARGLDLGKARFSSPFMKLIRFSLGAGFGVILAHNRRHLWLAHEVMDWSGFPSARS